MCSTAESTNIGSDGKVLNTTHKKIVTSNAQIKRTHSTRQHSYAQRYTPLVELGLVQLEADGLPLVGAGKPGIDKHNGIVGVPGNKNEKEMFVQLY